MANVVDSVSELAVESGFFSVIRVDRRRRDSWSAAFGLADRRPQFNLDTLRSEPGGVPS
jgi:hypothetical protein